MAGKKHLDDAKLEMFILEQDLDSRQSEQIQQHLRECVECRKRLAELLLYRDLLKDAETHDVSPEVRNLLEKIRREHFQG